MKSIFVTKPEYNQMQSNLNYLANKIDILEAENNVLKAQLGQIGLDSKQMECQIAVQKSIRYGTEIRTVSGMIADYKKYGDMCITINK